jgi:hypothetical protein
MGTGIPMAFSSSRWGWTRAWYSALDLLGSEMEVVYSRPVALSLRVWRMKLYLH